MIVIRLSRSGVRNKPFWKIVAVDNQKRVKGTSLETLGYWQPSKNLKKIDRPALDAWVKKGAKVSSAVAKLL